MLLSLAECVCVYLGFPKMLVQAVPVWVRAPAVRGSHPTPGQRPTRPSLAPALLPSLALPAALGSGQEEARWPRGPSAAPSVVEL